MNVLLIYPEFQVTFWSFEGLLKKFVGRKGAFPPLGLLTVAAMLPESWDKKMVDLNVRKLTDKDVKWADYVFVSAMYAQKDSAIKIVARCNKLAVPVVLGGPILELEATCNEFHGVRHFFLGESEETMPEFLADIEAGKAKRIYKPERFSDIKRTPIPLWKLINTNDYSSGLVQYSRACPFRCTFCNSKKVSGPVWRAKSPSQFISELDAMRRTGFGNSGGSVLFADENFIGNPRETKKMLLELIAWQEKWGYPFEFTVQEPITLADDEEQMEMQRKAGVVRAFVGIETFNEAALRECRKLQNLRRNLIECVHRILQRGIDVASGFIQGFEKDPPDTFADDMIDSIQKTGIAMAMVDTLQAQIGTELYARLEKEGRILRKAVSNTDVLGTNFVPAMPMEKLKEGYKRTIKTLYSPKKYFERILIFLKNYDASRRKRRRITPTDTKAFFKSVFWIGLLGGFKVSYYYWKTLLVAFFKYRQAFSEAVARQIYFVHFRKIAKAI